MTGYDDRDDLAARLLIRHRLRRMYGARWWESTGRAYARHAATAAAWRARREERRLEDLAQLGIAAADLAYAALVSATKGNP